MLLYEEIIKLINEKGLINKSITDLIDDNGPKENDNLSNLIYKLSCTTNQMWYSQDVLYKIRFMTPEQFLKEYGGNDVIELHKILKRACDLNVQRAHLMDAIDQKLLNIKKGT
jgi:hypothetical protein